MASVSKRVLYLEELLTEKQEDSPQVKKVRGLGQLLEWSLYAQASLLVDACRDAGLLASTTGKGNVVRPVLPLVKELEQAAEF